MLDEAPGTPVILRLASATPQDAAPPATSTGQPQQASTPIATPTPFPNGLFDALPVMRGICFEAAYDAAGQVFVLRSAEEHINLYDLADNSELCRQPVQRYPFDFTTGAVLAGTWSRGMGCTARHDITNVDRNDETQTIRIVAQFITEGDCPYELVRPFWVGIRDAQNYEVNIMIAP